MLIGRTLGKYRIIEHLGSGSMAEVYKAYQPALDRYVAIKVLHSFLADEENFLTRFQREAKVVAMLRHPNIIQVYDFEFDAEDNAYYMVMEFVDGPTLKARLQEIAREGHTLPLEEAIRIVTAIASALDYAHQRGMVHRDVKPANVMFTQDDQVVLADFGIARMLHTTALTASGAMIGTPAYMAPERGMGQVGDERADIYSLGVILYQLVTGYLPFDADTPLGLVLRHINDPLPPPTTLNPDLPPGIEAVITRTLAKIPDNRYQTAGGFAADLERAMAGEPIEPISPELAEAKQWEQATLPGAPAHRPPSAPPSPPAAPAVRPKWSRIAVLAGVLVLILLGGAALIATGTASRLLTALLPQEVTPTPSVTGTPTPTPAFTLTPDLTATYDAEATRFAAWMATYVATTGVTPTPSPTPTPTPDLTATAIAACVFDLEVVNDRQVWPSMLGPGQQFVKRWEIENTGTCAWPEDVTLAFVSGDKLEVVETPEIKPLSPEETTEIEITLRAPAGYGTCTSVWQLQDSEGDPIGEELEFTCRVGPTPTPRPTATLTITPTLELTPTPMDPVRIDSAGIVPESFHKLGSGEWEADIYVVARGGDGTYRFYINVVSKDTEFFAPDPEEPWVGVYHGAKWELCKPMRLSWWVTSAGMQAHWDNPISYPYPDDCP